MDWLAENWFFLLVLIVFIAMHLFGHGHHGHGHHRHEERGSSREGDDPSRRGGPR